MRWTDLARAQGGVVTRAQLSADGCSPGAVRHLVASAALERQVRGVYLVRGAPWTEAARLWTAVLATGGVLGFATGAHLWGMAESAPDIDVIVAPGRRVAIPYGVRVHRVFTPNRQVVRREGLPVTARSETALDHLGRLRGEAAYRFADRALQRQWFTLAELEHRLRERPGRQGNALLRAVLAHSGDGAAAESERVLHRLLRHAGIRDFVANHPVRAGGRLIAVVDVALPHLRLAIEVDGWAHHTDVERFQRDRTRQNDLVAAGWTVVRFTWADLTQRPDYVVSTILGHVARVAG